MKLFELLSTCQNQWLNGFKHNPLFTIKLLFEDKSENELENEYILKSDYSDNIDYLTKYRNREVNYWLMIGINDLTIEIKGSY